MMKAKELKPGDLFTVDKPDPESPTRLCLTNDTKNGLRFTFPNNTKYWCYMGSECEVTLIDRPKEQG